VNRKRSAIATKLLFVALALVSSSVVLGALINTPGLIVAWALGMGARIMRRRLLSLDQRLCAGTAIISAAIAVILLANDNFDFYAPITTIIIGIAFFATYFGISDFSILDRSRILRAAVDFMSKISYSLYLVHLSVILWTIHEFPEMVGKPAAVGAFLLISNLLAFLCYLAFEQHYPKVRAMIDSLILHRAENSLKKVN
jgi:peptidoglycan/LPS O-acetylase OafA/YrhL